MVASARVNAISLKSCKWIAGPQAKLCRAARRPALVNVRSRPQIRRIAVAPRPRYVGDDGLWLSDVLNRVLVGVPFETAIAGAWMVAQRCAATEKLRNRRLADLVGRSDAECRAIRFADSAI